jgi:hypothetical protein
MKQVNETDLFNLWLTPYHNTTVEEVIAKHPKEVLQNPSWFKLYPVTQEQHDEWVINAKALVKKVTKMSNKFLDRQWGFIYLQVSPYVTITNNKT